MLPLIGVEADAGTLCRIGRRRERLDNSDQASLDRPITTRLRGALALVNVHLLSHFVIGDGEVVSCAMWLALRRTT